MIFHIFLRICARAAATGTDRRALILGFLLFTSTERLVTCFGPLVDYLSLGLSAGFPEIGVSADQSGLPLADRESQ
jgi:hypothetical protein